MCSHRTVLEGLSAAADSSCLITNVLLHYGYTNCQCGNKRGSSLYFCFSHFIAAFLCKPFSHLTHFFLAFSPKASKVMSLHKPCVQAAGLLSGRHRQIYIT